MGVVCVLVVSWKAASCPASADLVRIWTKKEPSADRLRLLWFPGIRFSGTAILVGGSVRVVFPVLVWPCVSLRVRPAVRVSYRQNW